MPRYRYGDHPSQYAELTLPAGSGPVPVVVVVHGGFWRDAYDADLARPLAADLVPRGWAALVVEYRRVGRSRTDGGGGWPATALDLAAAVDGLAGPGQELAGGRLDLGRVVALGHSAGGHLAGWLAARPGLPDGAPGSRPAVRLRGFVSQAGVLDLVAAAREGVGGDAVPDLMGGGPEERRDDYALASPARPAAAGRAVGLRARHRRRDGAPAAVGGLRGGRAGRGRRQRAAGVRRRPRRPNHRGHARLDAVHRGARGPAGGLSVRRRDRGPRGGTASGGPAAPAAAGAG